MPRVPCRYYAQGRCHYGDNCNFQHDSSVRVEPEACRFFARGYCMRGDSCRYAHEPREPVAEEPAATTAVPEADSQEEPPDYIGDGNWPTFEDDTSDAEYWGEPSLEEWALAQVDEVPPLYYGWDESETLYYDWQNEDENLGFIPEDAIDSIRQLYRDEGQELDDFEARMLLDHDSADLDSEATDSLSSLDRRYLVDPITGSIIDPYSETLTQEPYDQEKWEALARERGETKFEGLSLCQAWRASGCCPDWETCRHAHGHQCETCWKWCLHPYNSEAAQEHKAVCSARAHREANRQLVAEQECAICLETISEKPSSDQRFGLLSCQHCFCLRCIRQARAQNADRLDADSLARCCPVCRQKSDFVTPSKIWPRSVEEKKEIIDGYKARLATIDCRYWMESKGEERRCPFGTSCFYNHPGQTRADGDVKFDNAYNLGDFLRGSGI